MPRQHQPRLYRDQPVILDPVATSEHHVQTRFMVKCRDWQTVMPELWGIHATPNGGKRSYMTGALLKAEGVKKGYPDVSLDVPRNGYHGWRCEFKHGSNTPEPEQEEWLEFLRQQGYYVCVYWSADEAMKDLLAYLGQ